MSTSPEFIEKQVDNFTKPILFNSMGYLSKNGAYYDIEKSVTFVKNLTAFKNWYTKTLEQFGDAFKNVKILEIYPFVNETRPLGFVMIDADIYYNGVQVPGAAFIRGGAVAMLTIIVDEANNTEYVVTTIQPRVPGSDPKYEEIPAGMIDSAQNFIGVAAKEMKEETGIEIKENDLISLGKMYPSIGGCDEFINLYYVTKMMKTDEIQELQGKLTGNMEENESIALHIQTMDEFKTALKNGIITDSKAMSAYAQYILKLSEISTGGGRKTRRRKNGKKIIRNTRNVKRK